MVYGEANRADGSGLPVPVDVVALTDRAGMEANQLDVAIAGLVKVVEDGSALLATAGPTIERLMNHLQRELTKQIAKLEEEFEAQRTAPPGEVTRGLSPQLVETLEAANRVTMILDRVNKMLTNSVKAQDQAIRLRTFIATGDEDRTGLDGMSEAALRRLINQTANGEMLPVEQRRG